jgi:hypothetical protein
VPRDHPADPVTQLRGRGDPVPRAHPVDHLLLDAGAQRVVGDRGDVLEEAPEVSRVEHTGLQGRQHTGQPVDEDQ